MVGVDIDIKTEKSRGKIEEIKIESEEHENHRAEKEKLKNIFALDADVENKLAKIMKKRKE